MNKLKEIYKNVDYYEKRLYNLSMILVSFGLMILVFNLVAILCK